MTRKTFSPRAIPGEVIVYLHQLAAATKSRSRSAPLWRTPSGVIANLPDDIDQDELPPEQLIPVHREVESSGEFFDFPPELTDGADTLNEGSTEATHHIGESLNEAALTDSSVTTADLDGVAVEATYEGENDEDDGLDDSSPRQTDISPLEYDSAIHDSGNYDTTTIQDGAYPLEDSASLAGVEPLTDWSALDLIPPEERESFIKAREPPPPNRRYPVRDNRTTWKHRQAMISQSKHAYHVKVKKALQSYRKQGLISMIKEMRSVGIIKKAIIPVDLKSYSKKRLKKIIFSSLFFKEKFSHATGELIKLKARLVAGGHMQDRDLYEEGQITSPTASTPAVFILAALAAHESRHVWTCDIGTAYLNAKMPDDAPKQLMRLDRETATVLVWLEPEYAKYVREDGSMIIELAKALYGCIESAKLWYNDLSGFLELQGFIKNPYDQCIFSKTLITGEKFDIAVYVDDLMLMCKSERAIEDFIRALEEKYEEVTTNRENVQEYLGMVFDYTVLGKVSVKMDIYIANMLKNYDITTSAVTPAENFLFNLRTDSPLLDPDKKAQFHSGIMRLMYLAKRARIDILVPVVYLASRVLSPTEDDWKKFHRILKYLHGTKDLCLHLSVDQIIAIRAFIDASFAVHPDMRSHTGCAITLGAGALYVKSIRQKLASKSSTEAELIALSDALGQVIWTRNFLEALGYKMEPATVYQDNMSTMAMIKNGSPTSSRTRHINIRFFFAKDRVDQGEIKIEYCPTEDMWADIFTKPLQGALFIKMRNLVLGINDIVSF